MLHHVKGSKLTGSRMKTIEDRITILNIKSKYNFFAAKVNNLKKENSDMKLVFKKKNY